MPPKKRNRDGEEDPDPDQLDKDELKGMLRDSIDREAALTVQLENQKAELEAKMEEQKKQSLDEKTELLDQFEKEKRKIKAKLKDERIEAKNQQEISKKREGELMMDRILLHYCRRGGYCFYANSNVIEQAEASGLEDLLDIDFLINCDFWDTRAEVYYLPVNSCTELVDIFENGIKAGLELQENYDDDVLFSVVVAVLNDDSPPTTVVEGEEKKYLVVSAGSPYNRFSQPLLMHLHKTAKHTVEDRELEPRINLKKKGSFYPPTIQNQLKALAPDDFKSVLKGVWVPNEPDVNGKQTAYLADIDLNRMVEVTVGSGEEAPVGFLYGPQED